MFLVQHFNDNFIVMTSFFENQTLLKAHFRVVVLMIETLQKIMKIFDYFQKISRKLELLHQRNFKLTCREFFVDSYKRSNANKRLHFQENQSSR